MGIAFSSQGRLERATSVTFIAGLALLAVFGMVFAIARGTQRITGDATALHSADEILRSVTVTRAQLTIAVHAGTVDAEFGSDSSEVVAVAVVETTEAIADINQGMTEIQDLEAVGGLEQPVSRFVEAVDRTRSALVVGDYDLAETSNRTLVEPAHAKLVEELVFLRDRLRQSVDSSDELLGLVGTIAGFLVAVLIPTAVILVYRALMRRQARQALLENRLEAEQTVSRAREEFIANASHELRTPLTSITGLALLLEEHPVVRDDQSIAELIGLIVTESADLRRMVEDMLTTARLDVGALSFEFDNVDACELITDLVDSMRAADGAVSIECESANVRCDPARLRQIMRNLLSNAGKYGGDGVSVRGSIEGRTYVFAVIDDGAGVPTEIEDQLFERFVHRGKESGSRGSVGLGLAIVRSLANGMGGSVNYRREDDRTHFIVRLPLGSLASRSRGMHSSPGRSADQPVMPEMIG
jgi:signal transduction histidine kinase